MVMQEGLTEKLKGTKYNVFASYAEVYWVTYDSGSVPRRVIFSPRETPPPLSQVQAAAGEGHDAKGSHRQDRADVF